MKSFETIVKSFDDG